MKEHDEAHEQERNDKHRRRAAVDKKRKNRARNEAARRKHKEGEQIEAEEGRARVGDGYANSPGHTNTSPGTNPCQHLNIRYASVFCLRVPPCQHLACCDATENSLSKCHNVTRSFHADAQVTLSSRRSCPSTAFWLVPFPSLPQYQQSSTSSTGTRFLACTRPRIDLSPRRQRVPKSLPHAASLHQSQYPLHA